MSTHLWDSATPSTIVSPSRSLLILRRTHADDYYPCYRPESVADAARVQGYEDKVQGEIREALCGMRSQGLLVRSLTVVPSATIMKLTRGVAQRRRHHRSLGQRPRRTRSHLGTSLFSFLSSLFFLICNFLQFGFDNTPEWKDRRATLFNTLHTHPKARFVTRALQFGSEPLYDWVLTPDELAAEVVKARKNLTSIGIPVSSSSHYFLLGILGRLLIFGLPSSTPVRAASSCRLAFALCITLPRTPIDGQ